jgi:hypothetical protein
VQRFCSRVRVCVCVYVCVYVCVCVWLCGCVDRGLPTLGWWGQGTGCNLRQGVAGVVCAGWVEREQAGGIEEGSRGEIVSAVLSTAAVDVLVDIYCMLVWLQNGLGSELTTVH